MWKRIRPYVLSIAIALAVGGLSALVTNDSMKFYEHLMKPPLAPPGTVFPIVWTILFVLMGISAALVYTSDNTAKNRALTLYAVQLVVNFFWPVFFFVIQARLFSFFWLLLLLVLVIAMTVQFSKHSKLAAWLQAPYIAWLIFAAYLNMAAYILNG